MENHEDFHRDDLLERAVEAVLGDPIPRELPPDKVAQLLAAVRRAADKPRPLSLFERIKSMKPRTRIAAAAAVLIAFAGLMSWLVPGSGAALAFGDVARALNSVQSATWRTATVVKGPRNGTVTMSATGMFLAPSHERTETTTQGKRMIQIFDGQMDKAVTLDPAAKAAAVINLKNLPPVSPFGKTFQGLRDLVAAAQNGKGGNVEPLGVETIDGRRAVGYRIQISTVEVKIWADPKTLLPVRVEETSGAAGGPEVRIVMSDFQVGADLDKSLFNLDVPVDYIVQQTMQLDLSKKPIAYLADALKWAAENNDGVFPAALRGEQGFEGIARRAAENLAKQQVKRSTELLKQQTDLGMTLGGAFGVLFSPTALPSPTTPVTMTLGGAFGVLFSPTAQPSPATPVAMTLGGAFGFLLNLSEEENDWHYAGKEVKLDTPDRPIFWYKPYKTSENYQVIYADLSVKVVPAAEAPKVP